jgi:menaquinone-9 beta-reductase
MKSDYVIIGGGVAGLACAARLSELGAECLVIESGDYPAHKVCGEFFSPESLDLLNGWGIHPVKIHEAKFHVESKVLKIPFQKPAGGMSHILFDPLLVNLIKPGMIYKNARVTAIKQDFKHHVLELSTGEVVETPNLILATGRMPCENKKAPVMRYKGIKAHFENGSPESILEMFLFKGAYVGVSPIENGKFNVACLADLKLYEFFDSPRFFIEHLMHQNKKFASYISNGKCLFSEWMTVSAPEFGFKKIDAKDHFYCIGDAAATIPPATGNGLTLALKSGTLAAEYAIKRDFNGFRKAWSEICARPIFWGKILHSCVNRPLIAKQIMNFPKVAEKIYQKTRL